MAESCKVDTSPDSSVNCANQFVEKNVVAAVQGVDYAADAALPILQKAGIVEIGVFAFSPAMNTAQGDAYFTLFSNEDNYAGDLVTHQSLGAESVAVVMPDLPTSRALDEDVIQPTAEKLGMSATAFYYAPEVDWTTFAATIVSTSPDGVSFPASDEATCTAGVEALRTAGFDRYIHASACSELIDQLDPAMLENVFNHNEFFYPNFTSIPEKAQNDIDIFTRYMERDYPGYSSLVLTQLGFHIAVQVADMLRQVPGEITAESVKAAMPTVTGESFFRDAGDVYDCSGANSWPGTTACSSSEFYTVLTPEGQKELLPNQPPDLTGLFPSN